MSYARFGSDSDVYVFASIDGYVSCCGCILGDRGDFHSPEEIVAHLREHVAAGHKVREELLDPDLYGPEDFMPMCTTPMCGQVDGHDGEHSPHRWHTMWKNGCPCGFPRDHAIHFEGG